MATPASGHGHAPREPVTVDMSERLWSRFSRTRPRLSRAVGTVLWIVGGLALLQVWDMAAAPTLPTATCESVGKVGTHGACQPKPVVATAPAAAGTCESAGMIGTHGACQPKPVVAAAPQPQPIVKLPAIPAQTSAGTTQAKKPPHHRQNTVRPGPVPGNTRREPVSGPVVGWGQQPQNSVQTTRHPQGFYGRHGDALP